MFNLASSAAPKNGRILFRHGLSGTNFAPDVHDRLRRGLAEQHILRGRSLLQNQNFSALQFVSLGKHVGVDMLEVPEGVAYDWVLEELKNHPGTSQVPSHHRLFRPFLLRDERLSPIPGLFGHPRVNSMHFLAVRRLLQHFFCMLLNQVCLCCRDRICGRGQASHCLHNSKRSRNNTAVGSVSAWTVHGHSTRERACGARCLEQNVWRGCYRLHH